MKRVKLLILNHTTKMGGAEQALLGFLRRLVIDTNLEIVVSVPDSEGPLYAKLVELGMDVVVISAPQSLTQMKKMNSGMTILRQPGTILALIRLIWAIKQFIKNDQIQIVLTNSIKADIYGTMAASLAGCPVVWFLHDYVDGHYFPSLLQRLLVMLANRRVQKVICNSNAAKDAFQRAGARSSVLATVYYPPITWAENGTGKHQSIREEIILPVDCPLVGLIGRIAPPKGQMEFVKAVHIVSESIPDAQYLIVGDSLFGTYDDEYKTRLQTLVQKSPLTDKIHLLGLRSDISNIISGLDMLVCTSQWPEGFGLTIAEGMDLGKPVVSTAAGGTIELVEHGKTGLLVPIGDVQALAQAMIALLSKPQLAKGMGAVGKERIGAIMREANCADLRDILVEAALR